MSRLSDVKTGEHDETQTADESKPAKRSRWSFVLDLVIVLLMGIILFWGTSTQFSNLFNDATRYQCYATAFWHGTPGLSVLPPKQCAFLQATTSSTLATKLQQKHFPGILVNLVASQSTTQPFHALPPEYPVLTLIPFSPPLLVPTQEYQTAFAILMALVAGCIYFLLKLNRSTGAAIAFAFYLSLGSWATAESRFDLVTAALTLGAVILAGQKRWKWAYALIAIGTLLKFYPAVLLPPLFIAQQLDLNVNHADTWKAWSRWSGLATFVAVCVVVMVVSLLLNVADTISPFRYFLNRPIQIESFPATLVWLGQFAGYAVQYPFTFQSQNIVSALSSKIGLLSDILTVAGLLYTFWLQWRGKIDLFMSSLLTLLVIMAFGKVLSPQYLIWVAPFVAYVGKSNWKWLLVWGCVALLTIIIFPFMYIDLPHILNYYAVIVARDTLIVVFSLALFVYASRRPAVLAAQARVVPAIATDKVPEKADA